MNAFITLNGIDIKEAMKGAFLGTIQTQNLTLAYTDMKAGVEIPLHQHPQEAVDIILEGELEMEIGTEVNRLVPGMLTVVPSNIPHRAKAISNCKVLTVLYPQRVM